MSITARRDGERGTSEQVERLVRGAANGEQGAWDTLVHQFSGMVWAVARAHRLDEADAADVVQATWMRLLEHLGHLNEPGRVGAWLATTARRESLRLLRHARRNVLVGDDGFEDRESPDVPLDDAVLSADRDAALWRSFERLRPRDRALLRLLTDGVAYEEISAALDMPIGSIGPTRARALARLRVELERDGALALLTA